jgi:hypothetical protein
MALSSSSTRANAIAQYQDNLRYWDSATTAGNLLEAILFLLQEDVASYSIAGRSVTRRDLTDLQAKVEPLVIANATASRARFVRGIPRIEVGR